ncbi:unnamed protein product [Brachionus calyciflorus]|uniref:Uncharacterized protein n=1 Tax=Brachionus calyciflorus TaxID=104777 RepID=A0A814H011_9BILA|nr:unnamed protein product [Brachionus calyciflorus]
MELRFLNQNLKVQKKLQNFNYDRIFYNDSTLNEEFDLEPGMIIDSNKTFFCILIQPNTNQSEEDQNFAIQTTDIAVNDNVNENIDNIQPNIFPTRSSLADISNINCSTDILNDEKTKACEVTKWRIRLIKVAGSLIMKNNGNNPSKSIKERTAKALIELYPVLKNDKLSKGYEHIYDQEKKINL